MPKYLKNFLKLTVLVFIGMLCTDFINVTKKSGKFDLLSPNKIAIKNSGKHKKRDESKKLLHEINRDRALDNVQATVQLYKSNKKFDLKEKTIVQSRQDEGALVDSTRETMEQIEMAMTLYDDEKKIFYIDDLGLNETETNLLQDLNLRATESIQSAVNAIASVPPRLNDQDFEAAVKKIHETLNVDAKKIIGSERFEKILAFRERWNEEINSRFGVDVKVTGF
jgi:hypothetical protein